MQWRCRQEVEDALWGAARELLSPGVLDRKRLVRAIEERTALYTTDRTSLSVFGGGKAPESDLAARALFFGVADAAKISIPLAELLGKRLIPDGKTLRILDLGAGTGAMGLGLMSFLADQKDERSLEIDAIDTDQAALAIYERALAALPDGFGPRAKVRLLGSSVTSVEAQEARYDLILVGSVLNELDPKHRSELVSESLKALHPKGAMIIIEPALRETSRGLHIVRDAAIESGATIFAPCTRRIAPCPALEDERDWCHEDRAGVLPMRARQVAQVTGLRDSGLKFSYLVIRHGTEALVEVASEELALRVVSQPQRGKGQRECFACSDRGRQRVRLLKRNRDAGNREFDRARRGDVLVTSASKVDSADRVDVLKKQPVELVKPAS